jgi:hypothetical protein
VDLRGRFIVNGKEPTPVMAVEVKRDFNMAQRRWCTPTCGRRVAAADLRACQRYGILQRHVCRKGIVLPMTSHTLSAFPMNYILSTPWPRLEWSRQEIEAKVSEDWISAADYEVAEEISLIWQVLTRSCCGSPVN